jgi:hypothetical protein
LRLYRALGIGLGHTVIWIRCPGLRGTRARMQQPEGDWQTACAVDTDLSDGQICMRLGSYVLYLSASIYPSIHRYIYPSIQIGAFVSKAGPTCTTQHTQHTTAQHTGPQSRGTRRAGRRDVEAAEGVVPVPASPAKEKNGLGVGGHVRLRGGYLIRTKGTVALDNGN